MATLAVAHFYLSLFYVSCTLNSSREKPNQTVEIQGLAWSLKQDSSKMSFSKKMKLDA